MGDLMYDYIVGKVNNISSNNIVLDNGGVGFKIFTPNPYAFNEGAEYKVYIHQQLREEDNSLYGFKTLEEREMFLKLISVKGMGPKTALPILATGSIAGIIDAIERENIIYLKKFPKIGEKVAKQIILDLKGKISIAGVEKTSASTEELMEVLKGLGYKEKEIVAVIVKVSAELSIEDQVKEALKLLLK